MSRIFDILKSWLIGFLIFLFIGGIAWIALRFPEKFLAIIIVVILTFGAWLVGAIMRIR